MEEFNLYEDLEVLHAKEKQEAIEDLRWKEKYEVALSTIQILQVEKKELNKKIKQLEINFSNLLDTARTEIKRKDNQICELRRQKDDICFRRTKPKIAGRQFNENANVCRDGSSESIHVNPFSREPRKVKNNHSDTESSEKRSEDKLPPRTSSKEKLENGKHKIDRSKYREQVPRSISREKDQSQIRQKDGSKDRDRSKDRSRHRNRSRNREDVRSRHRFDDRNDSKHKDRKERYSRRERDAKNKDEKRKRHGRDGSHTRSSDGSWDRIDKMNNHSQRINYTSGRKTNTSPNEYEPISPEHNEPRDIGKSSQHDNKKDQTKNDFKTEHNLKLKNVPNPPTEKQLNQKIEILQIEILKDVKEFKKNKLEAEKLPKPNPIDPAKLATEKSNQLIDALFDDSIINLSETPNDDLYDDLLVTSAQIIDSTTTAAEENKKENPIKTDENCNFNLETPKRQPLSMEELFGPSPAGSLCSVVGKENPSATKSVSGSSSDFDFVPIAKPVRGQQDEGITITDNELKLPEKNVSNDISVVSQNNKTTSTDHENLTNTDENFNLKYQTPLKQPLTKVMNDLFGPSPATSICGQTNSMDELSNNSYFVPIMKPTKGVPDEKSLKTTPLKLTLVIDDSSCDDDVIANKKECLEIKEAKKTDLADNNAEENNTVNDAKTFKFVELDSSFYSSEDEVKEVLKQNSNMSRDEVESPTFEDLSATPSKHIQESETELIAKTQASNISSEKNNCSEEISNISSKCDKKISNTNEENFSDKQDEMDNIKKNHKPLFPDNHKQSRTSFHSSSRSKKSEEICKRGNSHKHNKSSHNSDLKSSSEDNSHRSSSSKGSKEKHHHHRRPHHHHHHHHHHHRPHDNRSKESTHAKCYASPQKNSHSSRKKSKHSSSRDENETKPHSLQDNSDSIALTNDIVEAGCSPMLRFDDYDGQNDKIADQDQVFFLHCDNISSDDDDEIIGNVHNEESKIEKREIIEKNTNVIEVESTNSFPIETNTNKIDKASEELNISNEMESDRRTMNSVMPSNHENTTEIDMDIECTLLSMDPEPQDKVLSPKHSLNVAHETASAEVQSNIVYESVDIEAATATGTDDSGIIVASGASVEFCRSNAAPSLSIEQVSEDHQLEKNGNKLENEDGFTKLPKKINESTKIEMFDDLKERELPEIIKSESYKNDNISNECAIITDKNMALNEISDDIHVVNSKEADLKDHTIHESNKEIELPNSQHLSQTSNHLKTLDVESCTGENYKLNLLSGDKINKEYEGVSSNSTERAASLQEVSNYENPVSDQKLDTEINTENSPESVNSEPLKPTFDEPKSISPNHKTHEQTNCQNNLSLTNPIHTSPMKEIPSPRREKQYEKDEILRQITDETLTTKLSSPTIAQSTPHSTTKLFSTHISPQKTLNSGDELESSQSTSESLSSGRRKKIKTPRKLTDDSKNSTNTTMTMLSDRYIKSNEINSCISTQFNSPEVVSDEKDQMASKEMSHSKESEGKLDSEKRTIWLETKTPETKYEKESASKIQTTEEELQKNLEITDELSIAESEVKDKSVLKSDINEQNIENEEFLLKRAEEQNERRSSLTSQNTSLVFPTKTQNRNIEKDQDFSPISINVDQSENAVSNTRDLSPIQSDQIDTSSHVPKPILEEIHKEDVQLAITSHETDSLPNSVLCESIKENEKIIEEKKVESFSITIKRNRSKKRSPKQNLTEAVKIISNEVVNDKNNTQISGEILSEETNNQTINHTKVTAEEGKKESINYANDTLCCPFTDHIKSLNDSAAFKSNSTKPNDQQHPPTKHQKMMKHFMDSKHKFVGTCNYQSLPHPDDDVVVDSKSKETKTKTNTKKRKRKSNTTEQQQQLDNSECAIKSNSTSEISSPDFVGTKVHAKRKYNKRKTKQILDSSISSEDVKTTNNNNNSPIEELKTVSHDDCDFNQRKSQSLVCIESPIVKEPRKKRKYTKKNSSSNRSYELCESLEGSEKLASSLSELESAKSVENILDKLHSSDQKKRKYKEKNSSSSVDSKNRSNELCENLEGPENLASSFCQLESAGNVENILDKLHSSQQETAETAQEILHSRNEAVDLRSNENSTDLLKKTLEEDSCLNKSLPIEEKEEHNSSNIIKRSKPKKQKKRKLSRSPVGKSEETVVQPKRSRKTHDEENIQSLCDKTTSCPASTEMMSHHDSFTSNASTPTHHKIFSNDVFPNDPQPIYKAHDDDIQYHEIDDRLRSMFQSPSYTQSSNGDCTSDHTDLKSNCNNDDVTIDETMNQSVEPTQCDTSTSSRKVSLGSNEYVIESVGSHTANVFITRKKCKKRTKVVAVAM